MFDFQIKENNTVFDVVIVGSGAGGGMAAHELTKAGAKVCVLEAGQPFDPADPKNITQLKWPYESPRRGETFVTRKITRGLANIAQGLDTCLYMGNIDALRDWGHAKDYVYMQWLMLQQEKAEDFVFFQNFFGAKTVL